MHLIPQEIAWLAKASCSKSPELSHYPWPAPASWHSSRLSASVPLAALSRIVESTRDFSTEVWELQIDFKISPTEGEVRHILSQCCCNACTQAHHVLLAAFCGWFGL